MTVLLQAPSLTPEPEWLSKLLPKTQGQLSSPPAIPMLCPWMAGPGPDTWWLSSLRAPRIHFHNDQFHLLILARLYASETFGQPWGKLRFNSQVHPHLPWWCCLQEGLLGLLGGWWFLPLPDELDGTLWAELRCVHCSSCEDGWTKYSEQILPTYTWPIEFVVNVKSLTIRFLKAFFENLCLWFFFYLNG